MPALQGYYNFLTGHKQRRGRKEEETAQAEAAGGDGKTRSSASSRGRGVESLSPSPIIRCERRAVLRSSAVRTMQDRNQTCRCSQAH